MISLGKFDEARVTMYGSSCSYKGACSMNGRSNGIQDMFVGKVVPAFKLFAITPGGKTACVS